MKLYLQKCFRLQRQDYTKYRWQWNPFEVKKDLISKHKILKYWWWGGGRLFPRNTVK